MAEEKRMARLREAFRACDTDGSGKLSFDQFFALMLKGNPRFVEEQAQTLFALCDQDMSGEVDFDEFLEYIFNNANLSRVFQLEANAEEEECKQVLLSKPGPIRAQASKAVKARGDKWKEISWKARLDVVRELEKEGKDTTVRTVNAPLKNSDSSCWAPPRRAKADIAGGDTPASPARSPISARHPPGHHNKAEASTVAAIPDLAASGSLLGAVPKNLKVMKKFAIADKSQSELVDYSLQEEDLDFAGKSSSVKAELREFRNFMRTATSPLDEVNVIKFIAKGTAGWVFLVENKETGEKSAMKLIRMTVARTGIKEWFCSKVLRAIACPNVVYTSERVHCVVRDEAPPVIQKELENAGPVGYYMCLTQELMPWGTLEDLAIEGELSPGIMFKCMEDVANTLATMHKNGLQHRDVKPENIMLEMDASDSVIAAKMCDFGSAMVGNDPASVKDDIRRYGVTLFSVATGECWTKSRLIHEKHENMVSRLALAVEGSEHEILKTLPQLLEQILSCSLQMSEIELKMEELGDAFD